jgi:cystathionine gamma-lyase
VNDSPDPKHYGDGTRCVRAGLAERQPGDPFRPGPVLAAPYHLDPVAGPQAGVDGYGRYDNPTWRVLEDAIAELEGGPCLLFASGMAAITGVLLATVRPGETVMLPADGYYATRRFAQTTLAEFGARVVTVPTAGPYPSFAGVSAVLLETPANPGLDVCDIAQVAELARAAGTLVIVDNTTPTPLGQRPLSLEADISVASGTKALTGHSDLLLGYVCTNRPDYLERMRIWRNFTGAVPGPFETWLAHRSLGTLDLRLARQEENARALTEALLRHPVVLSVRWPGHPADPAAQIASRQMARIPGIVTFTLAGKPEADRFLTSSRLVSAATSFGGLHTCADRRAQWGDTTPEGLIRISCGVEDSADLVADVVAALDTTGEPGTSYGR